MRITIAAVAAIACTFAASTAVTATTAANDAPANLRQYAQEQLTPFLNNLEPLRAELIAANLTRANWASYNDDWKGWDPATAEANKNSFNYGEYMWSVRKDRAFRNQHIDTPAAKALKAFQDASGGKVAEFFVTCAKGGNVAQTAITSDWFQGDEEKVTEILKFLKQPETKRNHYFGPLQRDDTVGQTGIQVSIPLFDSEQFIGVAVVLVIIDKL